VVAISLDRLPRRIDAGLQRLGLVGHCGAGGAALQFAEGDLDDHSLDVRDTLLFRQIDAHLMPRPGLLSSL
jgi:hypothetical protein